MSAMCSCGHTMESHAPGECVGCTGPECEPSCSCPGKGIRAKLVTLGRPAQHRPGCPVLPYIPAPTDH